MFSSNEAISEILILVLNGVVDDCDDDAATLAQYESALFLVEKRTVSSRSIW